MGKKYFSILLLLLVIILSAIGCGKDEITPKEGDTVPEIKESYHIEVSPEVFLFPASGGQQSFEIVGTKNSTTILEGDTLNYSVEQAPYTVAISGEGFSLSGNKVIAAPNTSLDERTGTLVISIDNTAVDKVINLTQEKGEENEQPEENYTFLLSGASFATANNGWFELSCEMLGATAINRALSGTAIADMANQMTEGTLYSKQELEEVSALVIMHAVNQDIFKEEGLFENYKDYNTPFDRSNYAAAFDYVIKRYFDDCYQLKFDKNSKYFGKESGKTPAIILCTDWHDARVVYNTSVRQLASKWDFPLVEFDTNIGFSRNELDPVTGLQPSRLHSADTQTIGGIVYGWHPHRGKDQYIQQRMASIFMDKIQEIFPDLAHLRSDTPLLQSEDY